MLCKSRLSFFQRSLKTRETDMAAELPGDVLSEIFTHYLPDFPLCPPAAGLGSPALLSHVCSKWREFALDFAALWRAIPVSVTTYSLPQAANILETWLHRSRSSALSIQLFLYGFIDSTSSFKKFFEMVTANSHRIEHLDLWLYHHHFTLFSGPFPVLKSLRYTPPIRDPLYTSAENQGYSSVKIFKGAVTPLFNEAPKLTEFEITSMWVPPIVFPWKQITRFVCREGISVKVLYGVLKNLAGSVVYCDVRFILGEMDQHKPPIRLAKLKTLIARNAIGAVEFLSSLTLPALRVLDLHECGVQPGHGSVYHVLVDLVERSGYCAVEDLWVADPEGAAAQAKYQTAFPFAMRVRVDRA